MERHLFNLKFAAKEMLRNSKHCEKLEKLDREKCKKAMKQGNIEGAKIHAENAIRQRNQSLHYLRMNARLDGAASRIQDAVTMHRVTHTLSGIVKSMDVALKRMNLEEVSALMDKFDRQSDEVDIQTATMNDSMGQTTALGIPHEQVEQLMTQIADEAGLELHLEMPRGVTSTLNTPTETATSSKNGDVLDAKLQSLRNM